MTIAQSDQKIVMLETQEALELVELTLLKANLEHAIKAMSLYYEIDDGHQPGQTFDVVKPSLFRDAIVQFVACFHPEGKNYHLIPDDVYAGDAEALKRYDILFDWRNSFAAHNFGILRQGAAAIAIQSDGYHLAILDFRTYGLSGHTRDEILPLFQNAIDNNDARIAGVAKVVTEQFHAMTHEETVALPLLRLVIPADHEIPNARKGLSRKNQPVQKRGPKGPTS